MPLLVPDLENINNEAQIQPPKHAMNDGQDFQPEERGETSDGQNEPRAYFDTLGNSYTSIPSGYQAVVVSWMVTLTDDDKVATITGNGASISNEIATAPIQVSILKPIEPESTVSETSSESSSEESTNTKRVTSTTTSTTTMTSTTTRTSKETVYISDVSSEATDLSPLDDFSTVTLSDVESSSSSSSSTEAIMFSTITIGDLIPPASTWSTSSSASQSLDIPPTSTQGPRSAQDSLSKVEWIGIGVGIVVVLALIFLTVAILLRRRRTPPPADSQNNINIRLDNGPFPRSAWSTSNSQASVSRYTDSRELKTNFFPQTFGSASAPPNFEKLNQRYWAGDYQGYDLGVQGTGGEASGSQYAEGYSSGVYNDPKWKGKQREEY
ncbi:hypothetical protein ACHAPJ_005646 [Fusarium lateritium]